MADFLDARTRMVDSQLRPNAVTDRELLKTMGEVERERFLPADKRDLAYLDRDIPIHDGPSGRRYMMNPMYFAQLVQLAEIGKGDLVLDVGCGAGYSAAVLAHLADAVVALESEPALVERASENLSDYDVDNAVVVEGPLERGYADEGPYDVIFFNGEIAELPEIFDSQLREGGRLVAAERRDNVGRGVLYRKIAGRLSGVPAFDVVVKPLPGFQRKAAFVF